MTLLDPAVVEAELAPQPRALTRWRRRVGSVEAVAVVLLLGYLLHGTSPADRTRRTRRGTGERSCRSVRRSALPRSTSASPVTPAVRAKCCDGGSTTGRWRR